jgi:pentatricopeptide repeat protein
MVAFAKKGNIEKVEELEEEAKSKYMLDPPSINRFNALILAYTKANRALDAEKVLKEMIKDHGMKPDVVCFTTVIDAYKRVHDYPKCWELFEDYRVQHSEGKNADEFLYTFMIRICAATHDSEKAIRLFSEMETYGYVEHCFTYNAIIFALASTTRYAS